MRHTFTAVAFIAFSWLTGCHKDREAHYATAAEARAQGAFSQGWLPDVMNSDAYEIREFHNPATNHGGASFQYADPLADRLKDECTPVASSERLATSFNGRTDETAGELAKRGVLAFKCGRFTVAVNTNKHLGILWH